MKVTNSLVTGDELNTFMVVRSGSVALTGNQCRTVQDIQDHYYTNIWASPWPYLATNRLPVYQWIQPSSEYIASQGYTGYVTGPCFGAEGYYEEYREFYVNFTTPMPGPGQVNMLFTNGSGQSVLFYEGSEGVTYGTTCGCPPTDCFDLASAEILFY
jgi:hypothetical protein